MCLSGLQEGRVSESHTEAFIITLSMQGRMQFYCTVCNKEMNCVNSMTEHSHSGAHQKNIDRGKRCDENKSRTAAQQYEKNSLQYKLLTSSTQAIGLHMVEEFQVTSRSKAYFKCNLCGAHGRMDSMYYHLIGVKHTEKYLKRRVNIETTQLNSRTREEYRQLDLEAEGSRIEEITHIEGKHMFPQEWLTEGQPKGNQVTEDVDGFPGQKSQYDKYKHNCYKLEKVDSKDKACQTDHEDPFENIMTVLSTQHSMMLDDNFTLYGPDQALACMQVMFPLGETIYEATNKEMKRQTDLDTLQKEHSKKKNLNKFLGLLQHILIPRAEQDCQVSLMHNIMKTDY
ncbi:uncharacterized protein LOC125046737 isoform X2 [Penaeus chinensis]|uniref:uncharacterized protein LOC125046737 isoform X2 n=1 Tax=Penaeus chinensis TaxID=139456 RepID=UPI001FB6F8C1|nr:uncharacterized protein LOC125046737 isoform X2 [Penaeus chinensis]